ncbi:hypothetical protein [Hymenobacter rigui]|uniref:Uncharacterized protein n=1 Tax=Hymenobacter rigui TaxID=334424 RepID=A0A3R9P9S3_9BACT|nr:hypothetical protein [Hymenobacter rigui]RSK47327.1 hypothetical protein EI291_15525 [Hymenobacter rigui]
MAVGPELLLLDVLVPETTISRWTPTGPKLLHTARNLTHWLASDNTLLFADAAGVQHLRWGIVELLHPAERVLWFDDALNILQQLPPEELLTPAGAGTALLHQPGPPATSTRLAGVWPPLRLVAAGGQRFVRHQSALLPLTDLSHRLPLPASDEYGPVVPLGAGLLYLSGEGQLFTSTDGSHWVPLLGRFSQLVPAGPTEVLATGRRGTVLLRAG